MFLSVEIVASVELGIFISDGCRRQGNLEHADVRPKDFMMEMSESLWRGTIVVLSVYDMGYCDRKFLKLNNEI